MEECGGWAGEARRFWLWEEGLMGKGELSALDLRDQRIDRDGSNMTDGKADRPCQLLAVGSRGGPLPVFVVSVVRACWSYLLC